MGSAAKGRRDLLLHLGWCCLAASMGSAAKGRKDKAWWDYWAEPRVLQRGRPRRTEGTTCVRSHPEKSSRFNGVGPEGPKGLRTATINNTYAMVQRGRPRRAEGTLIAAQTEGLAVKLQRGRPRRAEGTRVPPFLPFPGCLQLQRGRPRRAEGTQDRHATGARMSRLQGGRPRRAEGTARGPHTRCTSGSFHGVGPEGPKGPKAAKGISKADRQLQRGRPRRAEGTC